MFRLLSLIFLIACTVGYAQRFERKLQVPLADSLSYYEIEWADLDNDGLLDIVALAKNNIQEQFIVIIANDLTKSVTTKSTAFENAAYWLTDYNSDNQMDILISGDREGQLSTGVFLNQGDFLLEYLPVLDAAAGVMKLHDLDQDGRRELIVSGSKSAIPFLEIYKNTSGVWKLVNDSLKVAASAIEVFDIDGDNDNDLFVSGRKQDGAIFNSVLYNHKNFFFKPAPQTLPAVDGKAALCDIDHDGIFDILLTGKKADDEDVSLVLLNKKTHFQIKETLPALKDHVIFAADLNSDGKSDINSLGNNVLGDTINLITYANGEFDTLNAENVISQKFGDLDRDGDLDLMQLIQESSGPKVVIFENLTPDKNLPPSKPFNGVALSFYNRVFMYWEKPGDDHTFSGSLTFDLTLQSVREDLLTGEFDLLNEKRLIVSHGNQGTSNYTLLRPRISGGLNFNIQAIDNSFHAGKPDGVPGVSGLCVGGVTNCTSTVETIDLEACRNEQITLSAGQGALWYSFSTGFLQVSDSYNFLALSSDTIFSFVPALDSCAALKAYAITVSDTLTKKTEQIIYACEGSILRLGVEPVWQRVEWRSALKGFISADDSISVTVTLPDTISVTISNETGCTIQRNTIVKVSKPIIELSGDAFRILRGSSVQLSAFGGVEYTWTPSIGLSNDNIPDPMASPPVTTAYVVTVKDSIGCPASATVLVVVEGTAFIPTLFTPNGDGKNDELKIYGLSNVKNFSFTIHNREGSVVYETHNASDATLTGWNGAVNGNQQSGGIYYWKVKGELTSGRQLKLNGKSSGSIVLIR